MLENRVVFQIFNDWYFTGTLIPWYHRWEEYVFYIVNEVQKYFIISILKRIFKRLEANLSFVIRYLMLLPILTPSYYLSVTISTRCLVHFSVSSNISAMRQRTLFDLILLVQLDRAQVVCPVHKPSHSFALTSVCRP